MACIVIAPAGFAPGTGSASEASAATTAATTAGPGSLVYLAADRVYVAHTDGSGTHAVTGPSAWWAWPSQSNDGVIAVGGGNERVNPGGVTESSGRSEVYAFTQLGRSLLASPVETPGSVSSPTTPTYVSHFRISPDGSQVAYNVLGCCGMSGESTFVSPLAAGSSDWRDFQDDYVDPQWVDGLRDPNVDVSNALALTHNGIPVWGNADYAIYNGANDNSGDGRGWVGDGAIPDGWDFQAFFNPDLTTLGLFLDDASSSQDNVPQHVEIAFERLSYDGTNTALCTVTLPAGSFTSTGALNASPTVSPDGSTLAWAQDDGIYEMSLADPGSCSAMTASVHRVIAGGSMPSFSSAALVTPHPVATIGLPRHVRAKHRVRFSGAASHESDGAIASYRWRFGDGQAGTGARLRHSYRRRGRYTVTLVVTDQIGRTARTTRRLSVTR